MTTFIPGIELSRRFYFEAVRPLLDLHHPNLSHAAGLLGTGSDILGFDDAMSTDHEWGPTVIIFLEEEDYDLAADIRQMLSQDLPHHCEARRRALVGPPAYLRLCQDLHARLGDRDLHQSKPFCDLPGHGRGD